MPVVGCLSVEVVAVGGSLDQGQLHLLIVLVDFAVSMNVQFSRLLPLGRAFSSLLSKHSLRLVALVSERHWLQHVIRQMVASSPHERLLVESAGLLLLVPALGTGDGFAAGPLKVIGRRDYVVAVGGRRLVEGVPLQDFSLDRTQHLHLLLRKVFSLEVFLSDVVHENIVLHRLLLSLTWFSGRSVTLGRRVRGNKLGRRLLLDLSLGLRVRHFRLEGANSWSVSRSVRAQLG